MAEEKQEKKKNFWDRRRVYVDDYEVDEDGKYVYRGKAYRWNAPRNKTLGLFWALSILTLLLQVGGGCVTNVGMTGRTWVMLPYMVGLIAVVLLVWAVYELTDGGDPVREYNYNKSVKKMPRRCLYVIVCNGLAILGELINLLWRSQYNGTVAGALLYMLIEAAGLAMALVIRVRFQNLSWTFIDDTGKGKEKAKEKAGTEEKTEEKAGTDVEKA